MTETSATTGIQPSGDRAPQLFGVTKTGGQNASGVPGLVWCGGPPDEERGPGRWVAVGYGDETKRHMSPAFVREAPGGRASASYPESAEVDQVVRMGVGITTEPKDERVAIWPISVVMRGSWSSSPTPHWPSLQWPGRLAAWLLPTVNVMTIPTVGELTLAEQNAVLLESLTLDALGVRSGDEVKLTCVAKVSSGKGGSPVKVARVTKTVKAYAEDGYIRTIRATPKFNPRTDFVREPQTDLVREKGTLPSVWMGEGLRQQLGLIDQPPSKDEPKAGTAAKSQPWGAKAEPKARTADKSQPWGANAVLVSPSKRFVIVDHFREAALVAALGLVGVAGSISEPVWLKMSVLVSAVVLPLALILWRIRTRLR